MSSILSRNYKKNTGSVLGSAFKGYLTILALIFGIALFSTSPTVNPTKKDKVSITYLTPEEYQKRINDIKVIPWVGGTNDEFSTDTNENEKSKPHTYVSDSNFVLKDMDPSKLTATQIAMIREFVQIINEAADYGGIEPWMLCGELLCEHTLSQVGNSGIYLPQLGFNFNHYGKSWKNGKVINFTNMNTQMYRDEGITGNNWEAGPFQFNNDQTFDRCSLVESAKAAAKRTSPTGAFGKTMRDYFSEVGASDDLLNSLSIVAHNTGDAGMRVRVPKDARKDFVDIFDNMFSQKEDITKLGEVSMKQHNSPMEYSLVWKVICESDADNKVVLYPNTKTKLSTNLPDYRITKQVREASPNRYPGNTRGDRVYNWGGAGSNRLYISDFNYENIYQDMGDGKPLWLMSRVETKYLVSSYAGGKTLWNSLNKALSEVDNNTHLGGGQGLSYIWQSLAGFSPTAINYNDAHIMGEFGQVGYKGNFPLFVQGTGMNDISNLPWKFNGSPTTLGSSGCSMFALMSLIHGVGYGDLPLPNKDLPSDGLNDEGYICFEELSKILTNGPLLSDDANYLGYRTKTVPTDRAGLEELYSYLKQGIPFIVNVRYGDVGGYDANGIKHIVHFTNSGHFMIFSGAYEEDGKRYVEVVQSTYSNAGTAANDENALVFDYDELIDKEIIRSSFGSCVPAYTIIGRTDNLREPIYMNSNYQVKPDSTPTAKDISNDDQQAVESINHLISAISEVNYILLPKNMYVGVGKDYVDLYITDKDFLRVTGITFYTEIKESGYYNKNEYIGLTQEDTTFTRFRLNEDGSAEEVGLK